MTVNTSSITSGPYTGNGVVSQFDYTFRVELKTQLIVYETDTVGNVATLTVDVDYTVNDVGSVSGTIDRVAGALPSGYTWYIRSNYQPTQQTSFESQGAFFPLLHENAFDKNAFLFQQLIDLNSRTFRIAESDPEVAAILELPGVELRKNKFMSFDENGDVTVVTAVGTWRGDWTTATIYNRLDIYKDPANDNIYVVAEDHTSTTVAADVISGYVDLVIDAEAASASAAAAAASEAAAAVSEAAAAADAVSTAADAVTTAQDAIDTAADAVSTAADVVSTAADASDAAASAAAAASAIFAKNIIINGDFDIWQRGVTDTFTSVPTYVADRWLCSYSSGATSTTVSQQAFTIGQTDVPNNPKYFMRLDATPASGENRQVGTRIEDVTALAGEEVTLTFWAKGTVGRTIRPVAVQMFGTGGSPSSSVSQNFSTGITLTGSWVKHSFTITLGSVSGKTLGTNGDDYLLIKWQLEDETVVNQFDIAQVQLEKGAVSTDFERRTIGEELALCQRYFYKFDGVDTNSFPASCAETAANTVEGVWSLPVEMRATPTVATSTSLWHKLNGIADSDRTVAAAEGSLSSVLARVSYTHSAGATIGLLVIDSGQYIEADAEL